MKSREEAGIPKVKNGEHRILQMQLDMHHEVLRRIEKKIDIVATVDERSKNNFKLLIVLFVAVLGIYSAIAAFALGVISL